MGHVSADPVENGLSAMALGRQLGCQLQHGLVAEAQADAGDEGTGRERPAGSCRWTLDAVRGGRSPKKAGRVADLVKGFRKQLRPGPTGISGELHWPASEGCGTARWVTGGGPGSCEAHGPGVGETVLGNVKRALDGTYHEKVRNHAPRYLAEFSYRFNRRSPTRVIWFLDSLMSLCRLLRCPIAC